MEIQGGNPPRGASRRKVTNLGGPGAPRKENAFPGRELILGPGEDPVHGLGQGREDLRPEVLFPGDASSVTRFNQ